MSTTVLLIDSQVPYVRGATRPTLLSLPLAESSVLDQHLQALGSLVEKEVWVTAPAGVTPEYEKQVQAAAQRAVRVLSTEQLSELLNQAEPSDQLLVVQARYWMVGGYDESHLKRLLRHYRGATFGVAIGTDADGAREIVEHDTSGRVRRVQRLYNAVSWPETATTAVPFALLPGRCVRDLAMGSLVDMRFALSCRGVLTRDLPLQADALDLTSQNEYLALNEKRTSKLTQLKQAPAGYTRGTNGLLVAEGARVDETARCVGPVVVQRGAQVEAGATLIGPMVVGAGGQVGAKATLAHAVVLPDGVIREGLVARQALLGGSVVSSGNGSASGSSESVVVPLTLDDEPASLRPQPFDSSANVIRGKMLHFIAKRALDIASAGLALIVLAPLLLVVGLLVWLDSPGPIFFSHRRERKGGKEFPCIKFRTMVVNAHQIQRELYKNNEVDGPQFKMKDDPRVTRMGRLLRATNIDELPQLINVLLGHMSLVGPRPSPFRENQICVPWRRARLSVRPGITGLWQICRDDARQGDFHQWIHYDITYVRNFSFWLDLKILIATLITLGGRYSVPSSWIIPAPRGVRSAREAAV